MRRATSLPIFQSSVGAGSLPVVFLITQFCGWADRRIEYEDPARAAASYGRAVGVGDTLYLAGDGESHDDPVEEAHQLMRIVRGTLGSEGLALDDLVQVTAFCSGREHYPPFNEVHVSYFSDRNRLPARVFVGSGDLLWGMRYGTLGIAVRT